MSIEPLVEAEGIVKRFGSGAVPALDRLSVRIEPGQVTGLVGPDGAGKTTLLRLFAGLLLPDQGQITVCGFDTGRELAGMRQVVSYMPQRFGLYEDLTVAGKPQPLRGSLRSDRRGPTRCVRPAARLHRPGSIHQPIGRQALWRHEAETGAGLCTHPRAPAASFWTSPASASIRSLGANCGSMVYELVDQGIGVVWSTAYLDEAERCGRVILLNEGKVLDDGPPAS